MPSLSKTALLTSLITVLLGCQPETGPAGGDNVSITTDTDTTGDNTLPLALGQLSYTSDTPGPMLLVLETTLPTEASVELRLNGSLIDSIQTGTDCQVLPAVTLCAASINRRWPLLMEESGAFQLEITAQKNSQWRTLTSEFQLPERQCQENSEVFQARMVPALEQQCASCHGNGNAGVFTPTDTWPQMSVTLINRGEAFYTFPSGQSPGHDARPFAPWDTTYRLLAEMVWRAENSFTC